ncbi:MAG: phosphodiesterase [Candidatus Competibacteraceae bacterium]|nr:phosphodiesterase [Candidatus Competibacteraceae bacterium]
MDQPLHVIQITDTHLRAEPGSRLWGVDVDRGLAAVLEDIQARPQLPELILATGDLVQDEGAPAYARFRSFLEPLGIPVACLPGNHDDPAAVAATLEGGPVRHTRHVVAGPWQFVLLDSTIPGSPKGHLSQEELEFLEQTLVKHPQPAVVCLHHQPVAVDSPWLNTMIVDNGQDLLAVLDRHPQVRAVIWGHIHQEYTARHGDILLLSCPSTCVQFRPGVREPQVDDLPPGYRWLTLHPDGRVDSGVVRVPVG